MASEYLLVLHCQVHSEAILVSPGVMLQLKCSETLPEPVHIRMVLMVKRNTLTVWSPQSVCQSEGPGIVLMRASL